ncbi:MAG: thioredoxin family protein [Saprospiraceae bacterium]|jgi:thioredoxin 1|nr:thioredoxin family protein [Saprospiraceae bacterium]
MLRLLFILTIATVLNSCSKEEVTTPDPGNTTSAKLTDITTLSNYDATIKTGVSLMFFHATWCSICAAQKPDVEGLISDTSIKAAKLGQVDVDKNKDITAKYSVAGQPVIIIYKDNVEKHRLSGKGHSKSKLADMIKALL